MENHLIVVGVQRQGVAVQLDSGNAAKSGLRSEATANRQHGNQQYHALLHRKAAQILVIVIQKVKFLSMRWKMVRRKCVKRKSEFK